ncbi:MAG: sugar kinase [Geminicoccaceae bacterium]
MTDKTIQVACIGECMVELSHLSATDLKLSFGGDTLNTAIYLKRMTRDHDVIVDYVTALGDDVYSDAMLSSWRDEGLGVDLVARLTGRLPGLYIIRTNEQGERSFTYWREQAAARDLLKDGRDNTLTERLAAFDLIYLSGITLSILDQAQRQSLFELVDRVRENGGRIAFDSNFRPAGWDSLEQARICFDAMLSRTDIALPTFDDEQALSGQTDAASLAERLHDLGVEHVVVKLGAKGCLLSDGSSAKIVEAPPVETVTDSTAAGDSFNAAFLASLLLGKPPEQAALDGHRLAGRVIRHRGAIIPIDAMTDLY